MFIHNGVDVSTLISGQIVLLVGDNPIIRVYNYDGEAIGMIRKPRNEFISTYPLGIARIIIKEDKYFLYHDPKLNYKEPIPSVFGEMCDFVHTESCSNYFVDLGINRKINDPDDYPDGYDREKITVDWDEKIVEVSYNVPWMNSNDDEIQVELPKMDIKRLVKAEERGEELSSEYISGQMKSIHKKILRAIKDDMEEKSWNPDDGMVEKYSPPCFYDKVKVRPSHQDMLDYADNEEIEYFVNIY